MSRTAPTSARRSSAAAGAPVGPPMPRPPRPQIRSTPTKIAWTVRRRAYRPCGGRRPAELGEHGMQIQLLVDPRASIAAPRSSHSRGTDRSRPRATLVG